MNTTHDLQFILPEMVLMGFAVVTLIGSVLKPQKNLWGLFSLLGVALSAYVFPVSLQAGQIFFSGMLINDSFSVFFREILLLIAGIVILISMGYGKLEEDERGEYYFFILILTVSMMLAVASTNLIMIYITLETVSILSYIMAGYLKKDIFSAEAGIKYFLFGVLSTGVMLFGVSLIYGLFGNLDLLVIAGQLATLTLPQQAALLFSLLLVFVGFAFKCSLVPFHMWTPDVYEGAPTPVAALFSVGPKAMGFALFLRVFYSPLIAVMPQWTQMASVIAILTMTVGNIMALGQNNIKRLLAYSTIAQAGYIFIGLAVVTVTGIKAVLFYLFVYVLMNLAAFGAVIMVSEYLKSETIDDYAGLYKRDPWTAIILTIALLSLAGIPPLAGFLAKFFILAAAVEAKLIGLAIVAVLNSVVGVYYYIRIVKFMFLQEPKEISITPKSPALQLALTITIIGTVVVGIWPHPIIDWLTVLFP